MSLPKVHGQTVEAVMKRAEERHDEESYVQSMFLRIHEENAALIHGVLSVVMGMTKSDDKVLSYASLGMALMYDCLTTQIEADELTTMYGEKEEE